MNISITRKVNVWQGDVLEAQLKSADAERGRLVESRKGMISMLVQLSSRR